MWYNITKDESSQATQLGMATALESTLNQRKLEETGITNKELTDLLAGQQYDFLHSTERLMGNIMFLCLGGSHAYGTSVATSDVDIRGCAFNTRSDLLGLTNFENITVREPDTVIYGFRKMVSLLTVCNPNTIELLGCKREHYAHVTPLGQELIDNRSLFLSQRAIKSFGGYAHAQLRRLRNALPSHPSEQESREYDIKDSLEMAMDSFSDRYSELPEGSIEIDVRPSSNSDMDEELTVSISLSNYPLREFRGIVSEMTSIIDNYGKLNKRNRKRDNAAIAKHAMHLIRLYMMSIDLLESGKIITYRPESDLVLLRAIREQQYMFDNGGMRPEFDDILNGFVERQQYAELNTVLPKHPDMKAIEDFVIHINTVYLQGRGKTNAI